MNKRIVQIKQSAKTPAPRSPVTPNITPPFRGKVRNCKVKLWFLVDDEEEHYFEFTFFDSAFLRYLKSLLWPTTPQLFQSQYFENCQEKGNKEKGRSKRRRGTGKQRKAA